MFSISRKYLRSGRPSGGALVAAFAAALIPAVLGGCGKSALLPSEPDTSAAAVIPETGEQILADALDEIAQHVENRAHHQHQDLVAGGGGEQVVGCVSVTAVFIYGTVTKEGLGVVVTERHTHPKGLLLITVRRSYGTPGRIVSDVATYDSYEGFRGGIPRQTTVTEIRPSSRDTIVTYVLRNGITETYTFRLPVVTRTTDQSAGTVRVTSRYALGGAVVTEVTDENQSLIRRTTSSALSSGALQTRTDLPDGTWRIVTSLGRADGSVLRETVSGQ
jgi:hypothetical protein